MTIDEQPWKSTYLYWVDTSTTTIDPISGQYRLKHQVFPDLERLGINYKLAMYSDPRGSFMSHGDLKFVDVESEMAFTLAIESNLYIKIPIWKRLASK